MDGLGYTLFLLFIHPLYYGREWTDWVILTVHPSTVLWERMDGLGYTLSLLFIHPLYYGREWVCLWCFNVQLGDLGSLRLSRVTSQTHRWAPRSKSCSDGTVISPDLRNPKKQVVHAAQRIMLSGCLQCHSHTWRIRSSTSGVMGSWTRWAVGNLFACSLLIPRRTSSRRGIFSLNGSPWPDMIWRWWAAGR